jgi:hypothetical protein
MGSNIPFTASAQKLTAPFTPTQISGCQLWLDAADTSSYRLSGANLTSWSDKSGTGKTISFSGTPTYKAKATGNLPSIVFNSTMLTTTFSSTFGSGDVAYFAVWIQYTNNSGIVMTLGGTTTPGLGMGCNGQYNFFEWGVAGAESDYAFTGSITFNRYVVQSGTIRSNAMLCSVNGYSGTAATSSQPQTSTTFNIGSATSVGSGYAINGEIAEVLVYVGTISTTQQQQIEGYLAWKWGLQGSLNPSHPYATVNPDPPIYPVVPYPFLSYAQSSPEFDPRIFSGCILWLDGADPNGTGNPPANGTTLTTWTDKSVSNFPFTSAGSAYNTTAVNGLPGITLSTNFFGYDPGSAQNNWQEVFAVGLWTGGSTFNSFPGLVTSSVDSDGGFGGGIIFIGNDGTTNWYPIGNTYTTPVLNGIQTYTAIPTIQNPFVVRTFSATAVNLRGLRFGIDRSFPTRIWLGFISEVICYNTALSTTQRQQVEAYLAKKWKVSALSTQNIYAPGSYLTYVNAPRIPVLPMRRAVQSNKFLPSQIAGLQLWLDAADSSTFTYSSGSNISTWIDKSPGANNLTTLTGTPTYTTDGNLKIVNFKSGDLLQSAFTFTITTSSAFFVVAKLTSTSTSYPMVLALPDNNSGDYSIRYSGSVVNYGNSDDIGNGNYFTNGAPNANASFLNLYVIIDTTTATRNASSHISISGSFNSRFFIGNVAEVLVYPGGVNSTQRSQIQGYLGWKWKLKPQFPSDHPFFLIPPVPLP